MGLEINEHLPFTINHHFFLHFTSWNVSKLSHSRHGQFGLMFYSITSLRGSLISHFWPLTDIVTVQFAIIDKELTRFLHA